VIDIRRRTDHYQHRREWLETEWHFSFAEYRDPNNTRFGPLRVVNNDRIDGGGGFPMHSHEDMEIITWVIEGSLVHEDSTGAKEEIGRNSLQKMSAGSGISHSEYNGSDQQQLHLIQIWIEPDDMGIEPSFEDACFSEDELKNQFRCVASGKNGAPVSIVQDASMQIGIWDAGESSILELEPERRGYGVMMKGAAKLAGNELETGDAVRITDESTLEWNPTKHTEFLWMNLP